MTKRISAVALSPAVDPDDVLAELLIECRDGVRSCIELGNDPGWKSYRFEAMNTAARLMKTSVSLAVALKKQPGFTHRIIVERAVTPHHPPKILGKTIHSVQPPQGSQD